MRSKDVDRLFQVIEGLRADNEAERQGHAFERSEWAEERKRLLNAALATTSLEFTQRQRATEGPRPMADLPREAKEPKPRLMGF